MPSPCFGATLDAAERRISRKEIKKERKFPAPLLLRQVAATEPPSVSPPPSNPLARVREGEIYGRFQLKHHDRRGNFRKDGTGWQQWSKASYNHPF